MYVISSLWPLRKTGNLKVARLHTKPRGNGRRRDASS